MYRKINKKTVKIVVIAGVIVLVLAGGATVIAGKMKNHMAAESMTDTNRSFEVKKGTISTTVTGTGTLLADDIQNMDMLSLLTVDKVYVEAGDTVKEGDLLATVDTVSVKSALQTLQSELTSLDSQIETASDDTVSTKIKSGVAGRVKKVYAAKGDDVADVMKKNSAMALLSLDGKMAVEITISKAVSVGDTVTVTLTDGSTEEGTVESVSGDKAVVTVTDDGPAYGETVSVSQDGTTLGSGTLYIHSELAVTGYTGTVSSVAAKENQKVSASTVLFKLKDTGKTAEYEKLVAERAEVADALSQVVALYKDPNVYARFSGTVQSVNCEDAELVKEDADENTSKDTTESVKNEEESTDSASKETDEIPEAASQEENISGGGVSGTVMRASSGGFVSLGCTSLTGGLVQTSAADTMPTEATQSEVQAQSTDTMENAADSTVTDSDGSENTESSVDTKTTGQDSGGDTTKDQETTDTTISALTAVTLTAPVAGKAVQTEVPSQAEYNVRLDWSPEITQTYAAGTVYTATLTYKASDGYIFDGNLAKSYQESITAAQAEIKTEVSADGKTLTVTAVFPATLQDTTAATEAASGQSSQEKGPQMSGSTLSGSAAGGYRVSSASASTSQTQDSETQVQNLNSYTETMTAFTIAKDEKMVVSMSVDEQDILQLSVGQTASVTLDAVDGETFEGTVTAVSTVASEASNGVTKYTAEVTLDKTDEMLSGMNASVVVTVSSAEDCLVIPEAALQEEKNKTTVYTTYDAATGTYGGETEVTTGVSDGTSVEIVSGLSEGDTIYYSYTESSSDSRGFSFGAGMQMPGNAAPDRQGKSDGNRPQGNAGGGSRQ